MIIDKTTLLAYPHLSLGFENCDDYLLSTVDILDIRFSIKRIGKDENLYRAGDGYIKIAASALLTRERSFLSNRIDDSETLGERLAMCADVCSISLEGKGDDKIIFYLPYDPLCDVMHGNEIDMTNSPSCEWNEAGDVIISYGSYSKQPKRKDNDYVSLVEGWDERYGTVCPKTLKIKARSLGFFGEKNDSLFLSFDIKNKELRSRGENFVFFDVQLRSLQVYYPVCGDSELVMAKMSNGRIYVGLAGLGFDFTCSAIEEWEHRCSRDKE